MTSEIAKATMYSLLRLVVKSGGTDLHLTAGLKPHIRVDARMVEIENQPVLTKENVTDMAYCMIDEAQKIKFEKNKELDFGFSLEGVARFRANLFMQQGCVGAALRMLPFEVKGFKDLGLPNETMYALMKHTQGLIIVTGATGSGKTTTLASMVDYINAHRSCHIVTFEDPTEYIHSSKKSVIDQRELGADTQSYAQGLKHVLRQDPDVIMIGEMRDLETIETALIVAETGHLVLATLHTADAVQTVNRIVDVFASHQQNQVRVQLSMELLGVISQKLVNKKDTPGRVLSTELLVCNHAVRSLIREQKIHQIYSVIQTGAKLGMRTMNQSLAHLYSSGVISREEAMRNAGDIDELEQILREQAA